MTTQRIALVTGASRGIGEAILNELAAEDTIVIGTATTAEGVAKIQGKLEALGINGTGLKLDVTQSEDRAAALSFIEKEYGPITILVNNAGITRDNLLLRMKDDEWNAIIDTNLSAVFHLSKSVLRGMMKARWGRIINISSVVGVMGNAGQANYAAAKAGLIGFSKSLAQEIGSRQITVNVVAPGFIETDMTGDLTESVREQLLANIPLQRFGKAQDIADAVAFLASARASYITGETLHVNGGMYMA